MAVERACVQVVRKPWGVADLRPWSGEDGSGEAIGELWFRRADQHAPIPALLFKLLFTSEPLSIQVHPDNAFARSIGLPSGKTEAWYILSAKPGARVALGLKRHLTPQELRASIKNGSIAGLTRWRPIAKGDILFVPAGTIHAIGAGIVLAEIQQNSDATFRLFDYGRSRDLHEDNAVAVSDAGPAQIQSAPRHLTDVRTVLIADPYFVLERVNLPAHSIWALNASQETWILAIEGQARIGSTNAAIGDAVFVEADRADVEVGSDGMSALVAYPGPDPVLSLLEVSAKPTAGSPRPNKIVEAQT
jgi:mannose-6-phosphate isomerase